MKRGRDIFQNRKCSSEIEVKGLNIFMLLDDTSSMNPLSRRNGGARLIWANSPGFYLEMK